MVVGDIVDGGIVFYVDETGENGLVAAPTDYGYPTNMPYASHWAPSPAPVLTGASGALIGEGKGNQDKIIDAYADANYISKFLSTLLIGGTAGWYLPSKQELQLLLAYSALIPGMNYYIRPSSTEFDAYNISVVDFAPRHSDPNFNRSKYGFVDAGYIFRPIRTIGNITPFDIGSIALPQKPTATLQQFGEIGDKSISFKANYLSAGSSPVTNKGIIWNTFGNPYFGNASESRSSDNLDLGEENVTITGLLSGVKYYFSAYISNSYGTFYSEPVEVTTTGDQVILVMTTYAPSDVSFTTAKLAGNARMLASYTGFEQGFQISRTLDFAEFKTYKVTPVTGNFYQEVIGLLAGTLYYYRAYALVAPIDGDQIMQYGGKMPLNTLSYSRGSLAFRPHKLLWTTLASESTEDPVTGYSIPGAIGQAIETPCRFYLGGTKIFKNEDSTDINQIGSIRLDAGQPIPDPGMNIVVEGHFSGIVRAVYHGQLSHRIDV